ncbi:hypothetical protein KVR01_002281 [Diaporthe batatas]|uniref:uncharacterized protein n=1 Tax=Diaporthe batatas TaxID=748121 RepID=UPI001D04EB9E|nr:uncharacterized protein KVR01_002281 [Diaporthe batatas]KAG8166592.1 hypothetical protein KVR01_002281 [Diaporthe batatas]
MGRRPNQVIQQYFQRGPKLADNSNRYPQTCKLCGENFPKGRIDSLTTHLTKRCPAISEQERIHACLMLNGIPPGRTPRALQARQHQQVQQHSGPQLELPLMQPHQGWTPLETLAEVSRARIDHLKEYGGETSQGQHGSHEPFPGAFSMSGPPALDRPEIQDQFTVEDHSSPYNEHQPSEGPAMDGPDGQPSMADHVQDPNDHNTTPTEAPNLSVAAAAAARLNNSMLDPTLFLDHNLGEDLARAIETVQDTEAPAGPAPVTAVPEEHAAATQTPEHSPQASAQAPVQPQPHVPRPGSQSGSQQPWGEITYMANPPLAPPTAVNHPLHGVPMSSRSVFRVDQNGSRSRHSRARFDEQRRKEVQQVRKIGACIRCRILRKTCSQGDPCDTCRKVLSPRIWRSGCVRTKFTDELNLYDAGVQIVHAQKQINGFKSTLNLDHPPVVLQASHFPGEGSAILVETLRGTKPKESGAELLAEDERWATPQIVMINDQEELSGKMEAYVRDQLPVFAQKERASFSRITVETAIQIARDTDDRNLRLALELWGFVEVIDRELKWDLEIRPSPAAQLEGRPVTQETEAELYKTICLQLTAAAERKASTTSKNLLTHMQRDLQDARTKIGHGMFFTILVLLICVEKSTWAFKAWEEMSKTINCWPLERLPSDYTQQGYRISELLGMLLGIRRALPKTAIRENDGVLIVEDPDPVLQSYFERINLRAADVIAQQQHAQFSALDSRTLELHLCANLLLPYQEAHPGAHQEQGMGGSGSSHASDHAYTLDPPGPGTPPSAPPPAHHEAAGLAET